jgi:hypothetical protein
MTFSHRRTVEYSAVPVLFGAVLVLFGAVLVLFGRSGPWPVQGFGRVGGFERVGL